MIKSCEEIFNIHNFHSSMKKFFPVRYYDCHKDSLILQKKLFIAIIVVIGNMHLLQGYFLYILVLEQTSSVLDQSLEQIMSCSLVMQGMMRCMLYCYFLFFVCVAFALGTSSLFFQEAKAKNDNSPLILPSLI